MLQVNNILEKSNVRYFNLEVCVIGCRSINIDN